MGEKGKLNGQNFSPVTETQWLVHIKRIFLLTCLPYNYILLVKQNSAV